MFFANERRECERAQCVAVARLQLAKHGETIATKTDRAARCESSPRATILTRRSRSKTMLQTLNPTQQSLPVVIAWPVRMSSTAAEVTLPTELIDFVESGVSILIGTRDAQMRPECVRGAGASVAADRRSITLLVPEQTGARTIANVEGGSPVAVTFSRTIDHRTVQVKGAVRAVRAASQAEQLSAHRYHSAFVEALYAVGVSRALSRRLRVEPCVAVEVAIGELFQQTPGPEAGKPLVRV
jgi:hypothetical protein